MAHPGLQWFLYLAGSRLSLRFPCRQGSSLFVLMSVAQCPVHAEELVSINYTGWNLKRLNDGLIILHLLFPAHTIISGYQAGLPHQISIILILKV